jgi:hypothetical protein
VSDFHRSPTKMVVMIDGNPESREIDCYDTIMRRYVPVLNEGEEIFWLTGQLEPLIVQGKPFL